MKKNKLFAECSLESKRRIADEIFEECREFLPYNLMRACQDDFKLCSFVGYRIVAFIYATTSKEAEEKPRFKKYLDLYNDQSPIENPLWVPVRYCRGNMEFGRVFAINHCAFSSRDSIVGCRDSESPSPQTTFRIIKGLRHIGYHENWTLFKLDPTSTDDMTGMLYSPLEKDFTIEFAHFPHEGGYRVLFHWVDC